MACRDLGQVLRVLPRAVQPAQYSLLAVVRFQQPHRRARVLEGAPYERALPMGVQSHLEVRRVLLDYEAFSQALQMIRSSNHRGPGRMAHLVRVGGSVLHSHSRQIVNRETAPPGE